MRTTLRLNEGLFRRVKKLAAETGRTLTSLVEDALREMLARHARRGVRPRPKLPTFRGRGLQPGVDLDHGVGLLDLMEGDRGPS